MDAGSLLVEFVDAEVSERCPNLPGGQRRLRQKLVGLSCCVGKFAAAFHNDVTQYFATPDCGAWINGLDDKSRVDETIWVFDQFEQSLDEIWRWRNEYDAERLSVFRLDAGAGSLIAREVFSMAVRPETQSVGPILHHDQAHPFEVDAWLRARSRQVTKVRRG